MRHEIYIYDIQLYGQNTKIVNLKSLHVVFLTEGNFDTRVWLSFDNFPTDNVEMWDMVKPHWEN